VSTLTLALTAARRGALETATAIRDADAGSDYDLRPAAWDFWLDSDDGAIVDTLVGWERRRVRQHFEAALIAALA